VTPAPAVASSLAGAEDTVVALATSPGRSAIAVTRISGSNALDLAAKIVTPWPIEARRVALCRISDALGDTIDHGLVTAFVSPDSFTGEDTVELSTHGGSYVAARLINALIALGARAAKPGEFTRRAVLNGKLDITQAEAIGDLIDARSRPMHRAALGQLDGGLSRRIELLRSQLLSVAAMIAYDIDFPEEDDGPVPRERIAAETGNTLESLEKLLATIPAGEMIREGAVVVIAGEPNVGKSSLFNALLGESRAIVTEVPGTTRDAIEGFIETAHWPVRLVDTAGFRETSDKIERMGIEVSESYLKRAHVVLACGDSKASIQRTLRALELSALEGKPTASILHVRTKADLPLDAPDTTDDEIWVSAETGLGLKGLLGRIDASLAENVGEAVAEVPILTRTRHIRAIREAREELAMFVRLWVTANLPAPVAAVHLQTATVALEGLIGVVSTDDVLDRVFSSFCVGK
jgi:tRNA modification GTPase